MVGLAFFLYFSYAPEWVKNRDSSYANSADSEFRRQVEMFYPSICKSKK